MTFRKSVPLALALLAACASNTPPPEEIARARAEATPPAALGAGDVIEIRVYREPDLDGVYRVNDAGDLVFPLIGKIALKGKNAEQVAGEIRDRLADGFLKDPQVTVFVREHNSQKIHVLGQVNKPGTFVYEPAMTVIQAITNAGGFTKLAATNSVKLTRVIDGKEQSYELQVGDIGKGSAPNFDLRPGDIIFVPEAIF